MVPLIFLKKEKERKERESLFSHSLHPNTSTNIADLLA
jgi:hypothetical protein